MVFDFDDRVVGKGKSLELLKLANEIQKKNPSVISRIGEHFIVDLGLPSEYIQHRLEFRDPFVIIHIGPNNDHILFHYCNDLIDANDARFIKLLIRELKLIKKDIEVLKKDKIPC